MVCVEKQTYSEITGNRKRVIAFLLGVILVGTVAGTIFFCAFSDADIFGLTAFNHGFIRNGERLGLADIFMRSFASTGCLMLILMLAGFGSVTQPLELATLLYRGLALGISVSFMYSAYGAKGLLAVLLMVLPHAVITSVILAAAAREALRLSNCEAAFLFGRADAENSKQDVRLYLLRFLVLYIILMLSVFVDCLLSIAFTNPIFIHN